MVLRRGISVGRLRSRRKCELTQRKTCCVDSRDIAQQSMSGHGDTALAVALEWGECQGGDCDGDIIGAVLAADVELDVSAFCAARGISRQTFYKYRARFQAEGAAGFGTQRSPGRRSRRRAGSRSRWRSLDRRAAQKSSRSSAPSTGRQRSCSTSGRRHHGEFKMPSEATIWRILDRRGFITKTPQKRPKSSWPTVRGLGAERTAAGRLHEMGDRHRLRWRSCRSRMTTAASLRCRAWVTVTTEATWETFSEAPTARWGVPSGQLTDNGLNFSGKLRGIEVGFEINLRAAGVKAITSKPFHPDLRQGRTVPADDEEMAAQQATPRRPSRRRHRRTADLGRRVRQLLQQRTPPPSDRADPTDRTLDRDAAGATSHGRHVRPAHHPQSRTIAECSPTGNGASCSASPTATSTPKSSSTTPATLTSTSTPPSSARPPRPRPRLHRHPQQQSNNLNCQRCPAT